MATTNATCANDVRHFLLGACSRTLGRTNTKVNQPNNDHDVESEHLGGLADGFASAPIRHLKTGRAADDAVVLFKHHVRGLQFSLTSKSAACPPHSKDSWSLRPLLLDTKFRHQSQVS